MRTVAITAALALAGCATTVADIREREPFIIARSTKSVGALSECFGTAWEHRSGATNSIATEHGFTMTLTYQAFRPIVSAVIDVTDKGGKRAVVVHAYKGEEREKLRSEIERCL
jgi:hypothetical protein